MEDVDTLEANESDEETMFLRDVVADEHDLLYLDSYLRESLRGGAMAGITPSAGDDTL